MTRMTDYGLHAMLPDGEHVYYGFDEKPSKTVIASEKALAFCTGGGIRYIPISPIKIQDYNICLQIDNQTMYAIEKEPYVYASAYFTKYGFTLSIKSEYAAKYIGYISVSIQYHAVIGSHWNYKWYYDSATMTVGDTITRDYDHDPDFQYKVISLKFNNKTYSLICGNPTQQTQNQTKKMTIFA